MMHYFKVGPKKKKKLSKKWLLIPIVILILIIIGLIGGVINWYQSGLKAVNPKEVGSPVRIVIAEGSSVVEISWQLRDKALIRNALIFREYAKRSGKANQIKAGIYELDSSMSVSKIIDIISGSKDNSVLFTIPPGIRLDQFKDRLVKAGYSQKEADESINPNLYAQHPALAGKPKDASLEGYLYPESFKINSSTPAQEIVKQSLDQMAKRLTPERLMAFEAKGLKSHEAIILASIIEREVSGAVDRRIVSQIFLKRLKEGISLGADATYVYAAKVFGGISSPELDSPYNTRKYPGLPPGPISNVDEVSLDAVANPDNTDYLFFVSGDDGKNYFAKTYQEHEKNIKLYCQKNCGR